MKSRNQDAGSRLHINLYLQSKVLTDFILESQRICLVGYSLIKHALLEAVIRRGSINLTLDRHAISLL